MLFCLCISSCLADRLSVFTIQSVSVCVSDFVSLCISRCLTDRLSMFTIQSVSVCVTDFLCLCVSLSLSLCITNLVSPRQGHHAEETPNKVKYNLKASVIKVRVNKCNMLKFFHCYIRPKNRINKKYRFSQKCKK